MISRATAPRGTIGLALSRGDAVARVKRATAQVDSIRTLLASDAYRTVTMRTLGMATLVTLTDALLAFPIAYYMARVASPRVRNAMVVAVLMPLWAPYLVVTGGLLVRHSQRINRTLLDFL